MKNLSKIFSLKYFIGVLLLILSLNTYSANVVKYLSNINGLSNNSVNCIFEDSEHIVWIGTWDGLNAYNGRDIKTFRYNKNNKYSISNNIIRQIGDNNISFADPKEIKNDNFIDRIFFSENKLILTSSNGLSILNESLSLVKHLDFNLSKAISQAVYHKNSLYISFYEGGCLQYNPQEDKLSTVEGVSDRVPIFTMYFGNQDILWIGSDGQGVLQVYEYASPFQTVKTNHPVRSFCQNAEGEILIGTKGDGVKLLNRQTGLVSDYKNISNGLISNSIYSIRKNKANDIFIGTEGEGVNILNARNNRLQKLNIPARFPVFRAVYSIYFSNNDSLLWLGTSGYGLIRIKLSKINHY